MKTIPTPANTVNPKNEERCIPTIHDVARRAKVAPITVSRVVNQSGYCSPATQARVKAAIAELGYVPNTVARSLRSRRTHTLALILTDMTNPFFTVVARGVEDAAAIAGFTLIICNTDESEEKELRYVQMLLQKQIDGLILVPARGQIESVRQVGAQNTPLVLLDRRLPGLTIDSVRCDSVDGAWKLTRHLLEQGHRHIALLSGPQGVSTADDRAKGYCRAMTEAGLSGNQRIQLGNYTCESGSEMMRRLLSETPRPTAIFAANNFIAIGAQRTLRDEKIKVPQEMSVVSFDDLPAKILVDPFLTVAAQPAYEMGHTATQLLLERIQAREALPPREIILPPQIMIRHSTAPPEALQ